MINKPLVIILSITGVIVILVIGCLGGILFQAQKTAPQLEKLEKATSALNYLSSLKVITSIVAFGEVTKISDRTVTLTYGAENLPIRIKEDAKISSFNIPTPAPGNEQTIPEQKNAEFKDIKVGDNLNVSLKILSDGGVEGLSVIIFPPFSTMK